MLHALAQGATNRKLAVALSISAGTVRWHLSNIYGKLGASDMMVGAEPNGLAAYDGQEIVMRVVVLAIGSRGDVQPYLALARGLRHVGHEVTLAAPPNFAALAQAYHVPFTPVGPDWRALLAAQEFETIVETGRWLRGLPRLAQAVRLAVEQLLHEAWAATEGADALVATVIGPLGFSLAERRGIPYIEAAMQPLTPTGAFPSAAVGLPIPLGPVANRLSHQLLEQLFWQLYRGHINRFRRRVLGMAQLSFWGPMDVIRQAGTIRLYAFSPLVVPRPADWPAATVITGYWLLPSPPNWSPPPRLQAFLDAGPAPVYVGFGSMFGRDPVGTSALVLRALALSGQRGVLARGWGGLDQAAQLPETMFLIDEAPHDWLFPQMATIVHHGGAGTTGAGLRAGVPTVVVPHVFDQAFWAERVAALRVGPQPIPRQQFTAEHLAAAITEAVGNPQLRATAGAVGVQIRAEYGVANAVDQIHRALGHTAQATVVPAYTQVGTASPERTAGT